MFIFTIFGAEKLIGPQGDNGRLELWLFEYHGQETALGANLTIGNQTVVAPVVGNDTQDLGLSSEPLPSAAVESS